MLSITTNRTSRTETNIIIEMSIVASADSTGIFDYVIIARDGTDVVGPVGLYCARNTFPLGIMIARDKLPVTVQASECAQGDPNNRGTVISTYPLFGEDGLEGQRRVFCPNMSVSGAGFVPLTNNRACIDEQIRLRDLGNDILIMCGEAKGTRGRRTFSAAAAGVLYTLGATLVVAGATISGHPIIAIALLIVGAVALIAGTVFSIGAGAQQTVLTGQTTAIAQAQRRYSDGVRDIGNVCCSEFITIPLDVPSCPP